jgi:hypothetical protein|tara:strand:- start:121 stop:816 length:696 start_codon:yes stop_codon:yes gene_type:complete
MIDKKNKDILRNERKIISLEPISNIEKLFNFMGAKEVYDSRLINSIYFDTLFHKNFFEAEDGVAWRNKLRVRWYGKVFNTTIEPILENKIKKNSHNFKILKKLDNFRINNNFDLIKFNQYINKEKKKKDEINFYLNNLYPNLLVSYNRKYLIYKNVRITLDSDLKFINLNNKSFFSKNIFISLNKKTIIEIKFTDSQQFDASQISNMLNHRINKFSKYQVGISETFYSYMN